MERGKQMDDRIKVSKYILGPVQTNCYMVTNQETKETIIIDPADNPDLLGREIRKESLVPTAILLTHGHFDHIMAVNELRDEFHLPVYAHEDEKDILESGRLNCSSSLGFSQPYITHADIYLKDGQELELAGFRIKVYHTPGHTKGGCCYYIPDEGIVFAGDTLFAGSIGRTDFPTGSMSDLIRGVREKLFVLPDETIVCAGHMSETTIGHEKKYNPFF